MIHDYINRLQQELATDNALEHSYRPAFKTLIESLNSDIIAVNEPTRSSYGAPDFVFLNEKDSALIKGYAETKDIYVDLDQVEKTEQLKRYLGYSNLVLTNYIEFRFFRNGEKYQTIVVAKKDGSMLVPQEVNFDQLARELNAFLEQKPENITNAKRLAQIMGGKAARIRANVIAYLQTDNQKSEELLRIYDVVKKLLVHDLEINKFADMYAQTLVYGLFVARYYDNSPDNFSRQEARDLIPASNSFLQHFFDHIVGPNFDIRLTYIVDELCEVFSVSDVLTIIQRHYNLFGESVDKDPIIHFYEDFLKEYDSKLRKQMGAYYTPVPVVNFIIRAVDEILKTEFNLPDGLASTEKVEHQTVIQGKKRKVQLHKVQILDPAVGTATFLNETIKFIYKMFKGQEGLWQSYVDEELLPRLYGFELMMAPYTIAHLKIAMTLKETSIDHFSRRLGIYLTNTLEEGVKIGDDLFSFGLAEAISVEAQQASIIKNDRPIMVVMGNPPYSVESNNKTDFSKKLVAKYKFEPGGKQKLQERNSKMLNDDYVKFISFAENLVNKTGEGVVAMITNHGYLENRTFRGMRWHLTKTFNKIYVFDLHGNSKTKEVSPDGSKDENVFDIQQGVAIVIAVKNKNKKGLAQIYRHDLWGMRKNKFETLKDTPIKGIKWEEIVLDTERYSFQKQPSKILRSQYEKGISMNDLFSNKNNGIKSSRDEFVIEFSKKKLLEKVRDFCDQTVTDTEIKQKYNLKEVAGWTVNQARNNIGPLDDQKLIKVNYRPFDQRWTYWDKNLISRMRERTMKHLIVGDNIGLLAKRGFPEDAPPVFITDQIIDTRSWSRPGMIGAESVFPLYLYQDENQSSLIGKRRLPNLNVSMTKQLLSAIGKYKWIDDHQEKNIGNESSISPLDILDYAYATLHSPSYREMYKDFLKADFPRIPIAKNREVFWKLVKLGEKLRKLHLLEDSDLSMGGISYPVTGDNLVEMVEHRGDKVFINKTQYCGNVPKDVWEFYIGGYQPAQKWLKDRRGNKLEYEDIVHYKKIISSLAKTIEIIARID